MRWWLALLPGVLLVLAACGPAKQPMSTPRHPASGSTHPTATSTTPEPSSAPATSNAAPDSWKIASSPLPLRPDGFGKILPTPQELTVRDLPTRDILPAPSDGQYHASIRRVPPKVLARSTWHPGCPVAAGQLRYVTMSFWGFDNQPHTGEMLVNASVAEDVTEVFGRLYAAHFPIEEMRVTRADELNAPPTGDGNNTSAFVCKNIEHSSSWSAHAYGLAIDLNPFINPYRKGDLVLPELASAYLDRSWQRPGMVRPHGLAVRAFTSVGWTWGGSWTSPKDLMHFSRTGH